VRSIIAFNADGKRNAPRRVDGHDNRDQSDKRSGMRLFRPAPGPRNRAKWARRKVNSVPTRKISNPRDWNKIRVRQSFGWAETRPKITFLVSPKSCSSFWLNMIIKRLPLFAYRNNFVFTHNFGFPLNILKITVSKLIMFSFML